MPSFDLRGRYTWELLFDIDNTQNSGYIRRKEEIKISIFSSYDTLVRTVREEATKVHMGFDIGAKIDVLNFSFKSGMETSVSDIFENVIKRRDERREESTKITEIEIGPKSQLKLYRLVFNGPGVSFKTDTMSSTPKPLDDVIISCEVRALLFLESINVVYTSDAISKPSNSLEEVDGWNSDINAGFGGEFVWLVPVWTTSPTKAATSIEVIIQDRVNEGYKDMAKGAGGSYRYLKMICDPTCTTRISKVKLWRTQHADSKPEKSGWRRWTGDINANRKGDFLYICWEDTSI